MRAIVLEARRRLILREVPDPEPGPGEVRLDVQAVGVCGSDLHRYDRGHRTYPIILGHEAAGVIGAVGEGVDPAARGRSAALVPLIPDRRCEQCLAGRYSACAAYTFVGSRRAGAFAQRVVVPEANVLFVPDGMSYERAALIEPSTVARHLIDLGAFQAGQSAIVLGAGSIGLLTVRWLRRLGAGTIVASDLVDANLVVARELGADVTVNAGRENVGEAVRRVAAWGMDLVVEASGAPSALAMVPELTRPRGTVVLGGNQPPDATLSMTVVEALMRREVTLTGGFMSYSNPWPGGEWAAALAAAADGTVDPAAIVSHRVRMSEAPQTFEDVAERRTSHRKIMLDPNA